MRDAFFAELLELYREDTRVVFLTADLGYKLFDPLVAEDPARVINVGVREAGMVGFASGLARAGMRPFAYSIVPFITLRCLEQIKIDLCYNRASVVLVGVGGGYSYGPNGTTHHGVDDLGVLGCLPGLRLWTPADSIEVRACVQASAHLDGPAYLRLGRNGEPDVRGSDWRRLDINRPAVIRDGDAGTIVSCGVILHEVLKAADQLAAENIRVRVVHVPTLRPFPYEMLRELLGDGMPVVTVEEHIGVAGLGQEVAMLLAREGIGARFSTLAVPMRYQKECLTRNGALAWAGINAEALVAECRKLMSG